MDADREVQVLVTVPYYGNEFEAAKIGMRLARAVHYDVKPDARVEVVGLTRVPFDPVVDDGHEPPGYKSLLCTCPDPEHGIPTLGPSCPVHVLPEGG